MTWIMDWARYGDLEALVYMNHINKKHKSPLFDFFLWTKDTKESVYHLASKNDQ